MSALTSLETTGKHQEIHVGRWAADRRGLLSGVVERHFREEYDRIDLTRLNPRAAPAMGGVPCVGVTRSYQAPWAIYTYNYEGLDPSNNQEDDEDLITFELDITTDEASMLTHPNLAKIEAKYGKFSKTRGFPYLLINPQAATIDPDAEWKEAPVSPVAGVDSYLTFGATFKKSYCRRSIPKNILKGIGTIVKPKGLSKFPLPDVARGRQWLKMAPHIVRRGNCAQITENYVMAGRRGIVPEIYSESALGM